MTLDRPVIWWIRRDIRLADNQALDAALRTNSPVLPLFIFDEKLVNSAYTGEKRLDFMYGCLQAFDQCLRKHGSYLIIRKGDPKSVLAELVSDSNAVKIISEPDYSPYAIKRDKSINNDFEVNWIGSPVFHPPGTVLKSDGTPYTVFTPFSKAWKSLPQPTFRSVIPCPEKIDTPGGIYSDLSLIDGKISNAEIFPQGESAAFEFLSSFIDGINPKIFDYSQGRNRQDRDGTSKISPYLRFGLISARQAVISALSAIQAAPDQDSRKGAETWLNELIWREFYVHILYHYPHVRHRNFRLGDIAWDNDLNAYHAWCEGKTGYPVVDASMRQLLETGWMHNRGRMIVASFLTKDLLIDWRWGEKWFMQHLIDGDPAANNGGWQWTAGTGTDAAPYFRIFNPLLQSIKVDPNGNHIRKWVPELHLVPDEFIHEPWKMPLDVQQKSLCIIGNDYPAPIVDHNWARERALQIYSQAK